MSVIVMSASARRNLLSQTGSSTSALACSDEDAACRQARRARAQIAISAFALASQAQDSVLHLMR
jgi:hypothetical protein